MYVHQSVTKRRKRAASFIKVHHQRRNQFREAATLWLASSHYKKEAHKNKPQLLRHLKLHSPLAKTVKKKTRDREEANLMFRPRTVILNLTLKKLAARRRNPLKCHRTLRQKKISIDAHLYWMSLCLPMFLTLVSNSQSS